MSTMSFEFLHVDVLLVVREYLSYEEKKSIECLCWNTYKKIHYGVSLQKRRQEGLQHKFLMFKEKHCPVECFYYKHPNDIVPLQSCAQEIQIRNTYNGTTTLFSAKYSDLGDFYMVKVKLHTDFSSKVRKPVIAFNKNNTVLYLDLLYDYLPYITMYHHLSTSNPMEIHIYNKYIEDNFPFVIKSTLKDIFSLDRTQFLKQVKDKSCSYFDSNTIHYNDDLHTIEEKLNIDNHWLKNVFSTSTITDASIQECGSATFVKNQDLFLEFKLEKEFSLPTVEEIVQFARFIVHHQNKNYILIIRILIGCYEKVSFHYQCESIQSFSDIKHLVLAIASNVDVIQNHKESRTLLIQ